MMSRKYLFLIIAALVVAATGCLSPELTLRLELASDVNATYKIVYYASSKKRERVMESAISVTAGKGEEKCHTANPTMIWVFMPGNSNPSIGIYAERGDDIKITGDKRDPMTWHVGGNRLNERWSEWRIANLADLQSGSADRINRAVARYVEHNKDERLSVVLMLTTYRRVDDEAGYERLWNMIDSDAKDEKLMTAIGRADQLTPSPVEEPVAVSELKLHCMGETIITVEPKNYAAALLYFWRGDENKHKADIDSLKSLHRRYSDDDRLMTIDVGLAKDSMSWLGNARRDSVPVSDQWLRAWAPGGRMHSSIEMLRVPSLPWFIVLDKGGRQVYRGVDYAGASTALRRILGTK